MKTSVSAPHKANDDVKPGGATHATGTGHHMKSVAKKCKYFNFNNIHYYFLLVSLQGLNQS